MTSLEDRSVRPPSVDALARTVAAEFTLPHALLVDVARHAVANAPQNAIEEARRLAHDTSRSLLMPVINATGVLLHTNLGRAPVASTVPSSAFNIELDLTTGRRGRRHDPIARLIASLTGAESAIVVNNNAAAVMLVLAALATDRDVAVSRGESVEIGGGFRIPDVMEQSGARLVDVGTTNRTRLRDYEKAISSRKNDIALIMKVHPSNFTQQGFVEDTSVRELATLDVPVVADVGSGLLDNTCPWLHGISHGASPDALSWINHEPAVRQSLADGAAIVTFSGDKLLGGPQCGIIAGRADLVATCAEHPLMRAVRPGGHTMWMLQEVLLRYLARTAHTSIPFWSMLTTSTDVLRSRADRIVANAGCGRVVTTEALIGAGAAPDATVASMGICIDGDVSAALRAHHPPIIARVTADGTILDLRSVAADDDDDLAAALCAL